MSNFMKFMDFINSQKVDAVKSGDYTHVVPSVSVDKDGDIHVKIKSAQVVFIFNTDGEFLGIVNYKE